MKKTRIRFDADGITHHLHPHNAEHTRCGEWKYERRTLSSIRAALHERVVSKSSTLVLRGEPTKGVATCLRCITHESRWT